MKSIIDFFRKKWVIQLIGIIAVSLLIWFFGPLIAVAGYVPLESEVGRLLTILVLVVVWGLVIVLSLARATKAETQMVKELVDSAEAPGGAAVDASAEEIAVLGKTFDDALQTLKRTKPKGALGRQYLYELPWYIIIGPPGSGKTTALVNSGLEFPLSEKFGKKAVKGVGGTRNCDWWFTDQAVLLDTAGRYTTQDSHEAVDKAAWLGFLDLLRKHRPRRPVNGVLVAMSLSDMLRQTEEERSQHARQIRTRILELQERFGIQFPIYMLFTKCDLVAGFSEFFADLGREERAQVWGVTFPADALERRVDVSEGVGDDFDALLARLNTRLVPRLQDERDLRRRQLIFGYPQRMVLLKEQLTEFLQECFGHNRYQTAPLLRGVYFTSGTQEGTPIDRLMGMMAQAFRLDRQSAPVFSGTGRSYFIHRLLKDVIFGEAQIAGLNQRLERRKRWIQRGAYGTAAALLLVMAGLWSMSFARNQTALGEFQDQADRYRAAVDADGGVVSDFRSLLPRLDAANALRRVYPDEAPWSMSFGLYQGDKLKPAADEAYRRLLTNFFQPLLVTRLEQRLTGPEASNSEILYELLKIYLMFEDPGRQDAKLIRPWISIDWENTYADDPAVQARLLTHLDALLAQPLEAVVLNQPLVDATRQRLTKIPLAQQIYMRIKSDSADDHSRDFRLLDALGKDGTRVFAAKNGTLGQLVIPGLFTYDGFYQVFLKESLSEAKDMLTQNWVLGTETAVAGLDDVARLERDLKAYYYADYKKVWRDLLDNIRVKDIAGIHQAIETLEYASGLDSPVRRLLQAVDRETSLTRTPSSALGAVEKLKEAAGAAGGRMEKLLNVAKQEGIGGDLPEPAGLEVERYFEPLAYLARSGGTAPAPVDTLLASLAQLRDFLIDIGATSDTGGAAVQAALQRGSGDAIGRLRTEATRLPEPVKGWVQTLSSGSWGMILGNARGQLDRVLQTSVASPCRAALEGRYPMVKSSRRDATLQDFSTIFGPNGVMEQYFNEHLSAFVDTSGSTWRVVAKDNQSLGISASVLRQFQNARAIREVFFQGGAAFPSIRFELKPVYLDASVSRFRLNLDGQESSYRHGPTRVSQFQWPGPGGTGSVRISFETLDGRQVGQGEEGAWAWFRLLDKMNLSQTAQDTYTVTFEVQGLKARYELRASSVKNPFRLAELERFRCPLRL